VHTDVTASQMQNYMGESSTMTSSPSQTGNKTVCEKVTKPDNSDVTATIFRQQRSNYEECATVVYTVQYIS
jgi:hypothetical protein